MHKKLVVLLGVAVLLVVGMLQSAQQTIQYGNGDNTATGFDKTNANFTELYTGVGLLAGTQTWTGQNTFAAPLLIATATGPQFKVQNTATSYWTAQTGDSGVTTFGAVGPAAGKFVFASIVDGLDNPYDASTWDNSFRFVTENAIRDKIAAMEAAGITANSIWDAKGDLIAGTGDNTAARLAAGPNGYMLTVDSAQATGLKWSPAPAGVSGNTITFTPEGIINSAGGLYLNFDSDNNSTVSTNVLTVASNRAGNAGGMEILKIHEDSSASEFKGSIKVTKAVFPTSSVASPDLLNLVSESTTAGDEVKLFIGHTNPSNAGVSISRKKGDTTTYFDGGGGTFAIPNITTSGITLQGFEGFSEDATIDAFFGLMIDSPSGVSIFGNTSFDSNVDVAFELDAGQVTAGNVFLRETVSGPVANPSHVALYAKQDGKLYSKDDAGVETPLGGGGTLDPDLTDLAGLTAAQGDLIIGNAAADWTKLPKGTAGQVLKMNAGATLPEWGAAAGGGVAVGDSPTWTGTHTFTKPTSITVPTGVPLTITRTDGVVGYTNLLNIIAGSNSMMSVRDDGAMSVQNIASFANLGVCLGLAPTQFASGISMGSDRDVGWTSAASIATPDLVMGRLGPRNLRLGWLPSATPLAQTLTIGEASRPGIDSDVAGANGIVTSGMGTGTGTPSQLIIRTPTPAASGTNAQVPSTRLTLDYLGLTVANGFFNQASSFYANAVGTQVASAGRYGFANSASVPATSDLVLKRSGAGILLLGNADTPTDFNRIQLGGTAASFPSIKRVNQYIHFRRADDSDFTGLYCGDINIPSSAAYWWTGSGGLTAAGDGIFTLYNNAASSFGRLQFGGATTAFPALKRSAAGLAAVLANDSAGTFLTVADEAYGATWDGSLQVPTKNAIYDKILTMGAGGVAVGDSPTWTGVHAFNGASTSFLNPVGIGTATPAPQADLHILDSTYDHIDLVIESDVPALRLADTDVGELSFGLKTDGSRLSIETYPHADRFLANPGTRLLSMEGATGNVGLGIAAPLEKVHVVGDGVNAGVRVEGYGANNVVDVRFSSKRSGGTFAAPTTVLDGDGLLRINSQGYDGTAFRSTSEIRFAVDGAPAGGVVPSRIDFITPQAPLVPAMTIKSTGNVGIGTVSPTANLDVSGAATQTIQARHTGGSTSALVAGAANGGVGTLSNHGFQVYTGGQMRMQVTADGKVGIDAQGPAAKFHIQQDTSTQTGGIALVNTPATQGSYIWTDTGANLHLDAASTAAQNIILNGTGLGKVGIGTAAPLGRLDVRDTQSQLALSYDSANYMTASVGATGVINLDANGANQLFSFADDVSAVRFASTQFIAPDTGSSTRIGFPGAAVTEFVNSGALSMTILANNNVGIGVPNPSAKLEIRHNTPNVAAEGDWGIRLSDGTETGLMLGTSSANQKSYIQSMDPGTGWTGRPLVLQPNGGTVEVPAEAYGPSWDGSLQIPTKDALYDKIQTLGGGGTPGSIQFTIDGGGAAITTGVQKAKVLVPFACTITAATLMADVASATTIDVRRSAYPPTTMTSIVGAGVKPTLAGAANSQAAPSGWTSLAVVAGDILDVDVSTNSAATHLELVLTTTR